MAVTRKKPETGGLGKEEKGEETKHKQKKNNKKTSSFTQKKKKKQRKTLETEKMPWKRIIKQIKILKFTSLTFFS